MIVTRGLGRGAFLGIIVAAGLGLSVSDPGNVPGQTLPIQGSLVAGAPQASSTVSGSTLTAWVELLGGSASGGGGSGTAPGDTLSTASYLYTGSVSADSSLAGQVQPVVVSFLPGEAKSFVFIPAFNPDEVYDRVSSAVVWWSTETTEVLNRTPMVALLDQVPHTTVYHQYQETILDPAGESVVFDVNSATIVWDRVSQAEVRDGVQMTALILQEDQ